MVRAKSARLSPAQTDLVTGQVEAGAAELRDTGFKADTRAQRRLLEHKSYYTPVQDARRDAPGVSVLEPRRFREQVVQLVGRQVDQVQEMLHIGPS